MHRTTSPQRTIQPGWVTVHGDDGDDDDDDEEDVGQKNEVMNEKHAGKSQHAHIYHRFATSSQQVATRQNGDK